MLDRFECPQLQRKTPVTSLRLKLLQARSLPHGLLAREVAWYLARGLLKGGTTAGRHLNLIGNGYSPEPIAPILTIGRPRPVVSHWDLAHCLAEADSALEGSFSILGLGRLRFRRSDFDWHTDPTSSFTWPLCHHSALPGPQIGSDIKVPWEASRMHWLTALARAYAYTTDKKYLDGALELLTSWCIANPPGWGVGWSNAMEAGIRAINIAWATEIFEDRLLASIAGGMLRRHGRYILANLEYSPHLTSNHFLADVVGLLHVGALLRQSPEGRATLCLGSKIFLREVPKQFYADGMNFEGSTGYHRFSTELVLLGLIVHDRLRLDVPDQVTQRFEGALRALAGITPPSGRFPLIGDDDGGIVVNLSSAREHDDSFPVLESGWALQRQSPPGNRCSEMTSWLLSGGAPKPIPTQDVFPDAGIVVLRSNDLWCLIDAGRVGQGGNGGHAHNDTLSYVLEVSGQPILTDPGTGNYTRDPEARNRFRSTRVHATVEVDGEEINRIDPERLFWMHDEDSPVIEILESDDGDGRVRRVVASHRGYMRLLDPVLHRREWSMKIEFARGLRRVDLLCST